jgi:hypothetical protein
MKIQYKNKNNKPNLNKFIYKIPKNKNSEPVKLHSN